MKTRTALRLLDVLIGILILLAIGAALCSPLEVWTR